MRATVLLLDEGGSRIVLLLAARSYVPVMSARHTIRLEILAVAAAALGVGIAGASSALELKAPWSGTALVASGVALVLAGYLLRRPARIFCLAAGLALALLVIDRIMGGASEPLRVDNGSCDPTCGISAGDMAILVFLTALILASVGGVLHAAVRRL